jgi:hypothetical protein
MARLGFLFMGHPQVASMYGVSSSWAILRWHIPDSSRPKSPVRGLRFGPAPSGQLWSTIASREKRKGKNESHSLWACSAILQLPETPPWSSVERPRSRTTQEAESGRGKLNRRILGSWRIREHALCSTVSHQGRNNTCVSTSVIRFSAKNTCYE